MNTFHQSPNTPSTTDEEKSLNAERFVQKNNDDNLPDLIDQPLGWTVDIPENLNILANKKDIDRLKQESSSDKLTGLFNRRGFEQELDKIKKTILGDEKYNHREGIEKKEYGLLVLDIDKFKSFNDTYGHHVGDAVLKLSGEFLQKHFRPTDVVCRFGGEEFVILLTDNNKNNFVERMGKRLSDDGKEAELRTLNFPIKILEEEVGGIKKYTIYNNIDNVSEIKGQIIDKTISFSGGLVSFDPKIDDLDTKIEIADRHLYKAKEGGRDQIHTE